MQSFNITKKEFRSELKNRVGINSVIIFVLVVVSVINFALSGDLVEPELQPALFWIIVFFASMSTLPRIFVVEEEKGTSLLLKLIARSSSVFTGKLAYNIILQLFIIMIVYLIYVIGMKGLVLKNELLFFAGIIIGSIGIASVTTIISAIISRADLKGMLFTVLSFPPLLPLIIILIDLTKMCADGIILYDYLLNIVLLISYIGIMLSVSYILFEIIWEE